MQNEVYTFGRRAYSLGNIYYINFSTGIDLIGMEVKYHPNCFTPQWKKHSRMGFSENSNNTRTSETASGDDDQALKMIFEELNRGLIKGKGYTSTIIFNRYLSLNGTKSKKKLMALIRQQFQEVEFVEAKHANQPCVVVPNISKTETMQTLLEVASSEKYTPLYTASSEASELHKICANIKSEIDKVPEFKQYRHLDIHLYKEHIPQSLYFLISCLLSKDEEPNEIVVNSICQDIIYAYSNKKNIPPKHISVGLMVHQETRSITT